MEYVRHEGCRALLSRDALACSPPARLCPFLSFKLYQTHRHPLEKGDLIQRVEKLNYET